MPASDTRVYSVAQQALYASYVNSQCPCRTQVHRVAHQKGIPRQFCRYTAWHAKKLEEEKERGMSEMKKIDLPERPSWYHGTQMPLGGHDSHPDDLDQDEIPRFVGNSGDEVVPLQKYKGGDVIYTTAIGSRGTDWKPSGAANGLAVLLTYTPASFRVEMQIAGRSGRAGAVGEYQPIMTSTEFKELPKKRESVPNQVRGMVAHFLRTDVAFEGMLPFVQFQEDEANEAVRKQLEYRIDEKEYGVLATYFEDLSQEMKSPGTRHFNPRTGEPYINQGSPPEVGQCMQHSLGQCQHRSALPINIRLFVFVVEIRTGISGNLLSLRVARRDQPFKFKFKNFKFTSTH
jgi:hypothetical protein